MSVIVTIIGGGVIFGVGAFTFYQLMGKPLWKFIKSRKNIQNAKEFLLATDRQFTPGKLTPEQREERERALINSGFTHFELEQAQKQIMNQKPVKTTDLDKIIEWFHDAEKNGKSRQEAQSMLIYHGWDQRLVNKALKKLNKLEKKNVRGKKQIQRPSFPNFQPGTSPGDDTGATRGDGATNGDGEVEHKRIFPVSPIDPTPRDKPKPQRDWASFKRDLQ